VIKILKMRLATCLRVLFDDFLVTALLRTEIGKNFVINGNDKIWILLEWFFESLRRRLEIHSTLHVRDPYLLAGSPLSSFSDILRRLSPESRRLSWLWSLDHGLYHVSVW